MNNQCLTLTSLMKCTNWGIQSKRAHKSKRNRLRYKRFTRKSKQANGFILTLTPDRFACVQYKEELDKQSLVQLCELGSG